MSDDELPLDKPRPSNIDLKTAEAMIQAYGAALDELGILPRAERDRIMTVIVARIVDLVGTGQRNGDQLRNAAIAWARSLRA